jgi:hypothetical protein
MNEKGGREGKMSEDSEGDEEMGDDGASDDGSEESDASEYDVSILENSLEPKRLVQLLSILIKWAYHRVDYADQVICEKLKAILHSLVLLTLYLLTHLSLEDCGISHLPSGTISYSSNGIKLQWVSRSTRDLITCHTTCPGPIVLKSGNGTCLFTNGIMRC